MSDGNDLLMSQGRPWAKWPNIGSKVSGKVISDPISRQARDFETGLPTSWPNGDPKMEVVIAVDTGKIDPEIDGDDGTRAIVLPVGTTRFKAVQDAIRKAKADGIKVGGELSITYTGDKPHEKRGYNAIKLFEASYSAPKGDALSNLVSMVGGN